MARRHFLANVLVSASVSLLIALGAPDNARAQEAREPVWESVSHYSDGGSMGRDISNSIRVEDIVEPSSEYHYAAFGRGDPFIPPYADPTLTPKNGTGSSEETSLLSPLQASAVDEMSLVGIWQREDREFRALVINSHGIGVVARVGDSIGQRDGRIQEIKVDSMVIREFYMVPDGTRQYEDLIMNMENSPGGRPRISRSPQIGIEPKPPSEEESDDRIATVGYGNKDSVVRGGTQGAASLQPPTHSQNPHQRRQTQAPTANKSGSVRSDGTGFGGSISSPTASPSTSPTIAPTPSPFGSGNPPAFGSGNPPAFGSSSQQLPNAPVSPSVPTFPAP